MICPNSCRVYKFSLAIRGARGARTAAPIERLEYLREVQMVHLAFSFTLTLDLSSPRLALRHQEGSIR